MKAKLYSFAELVCLDFPDLPDLTILKAGSLADGTIMYKLPHTAPALNRLCYVPDEPVSIAVTCYDLAMCKTILPTLPEPVHHYLNLMDYEDAILFTQVLLMASRTAKQKGV